MRDVKKEILNKLAACRYMENIHTIPPVRFDALLRQELPREVSDEIDEMLVMKAKSDEKDMNPKMPAIQRFIEDEIVRYGQISKEMADDRNPDWSVLDSVFLKVLCWL